VNTSVVNAIARVSIHTTTSKVRNFHLIWVQRLRIASSEALKLVLGRVGEGSKGLNVLMPGFRH